MEIVQGVLTVVKLVIDIVEAIAVNKDSCQLLAEQWRRMETPLKNARGNFGPSHFNALRATEQLGHETIAFMTKFTQKGFVNQAWTQTKDKAKILELGQRLNVLIQELQLGIVVDVSAFQKNLGRQHDADVQYLRQLLGGQAAVLQKLDGLQGAVFGPGQLREKQMQGEIMRYLMQLQHQQHQGDVQLGHGQVKIQQGQVELMATLERLQQDDVELAYGQAKLMDGQAQLQAHVSHLLTQQQQQIKAQQAQQQQAYCLIHVINTHAQTHTHTHTHTYKHTHRSRKHTYTHFISLYLSLPISFSLSLSLCPGFLPPSLSLSLLVSPKQNPQTHALIHAHTQ